MNEPMQGSMPTYKMSDEEERKADQIILDAIGGIFNPDV